MRPSALLALPLLSAPLAAQTPFASLYGDEPGDQFGAVVVRVGDCNGDGTDDVAVAAPDAHVAPAGFPVDWGRVTIYSGADATQLWSQDGGLGSDFGRAIADAGDVDGDGRDDVVVGAPDMDALFGDEGRVFLLSGADGSVIRDWFGTEPDARFGESLCVGELDGELSSRELAVGAPSEDLDDGTGGLLEEGRVYVFDLATGVSEKTLSGTSVPLTFGGSYERRRWGQQLAYLGDLDGDGRGTLAVTAPYTNLISAFLGSPPTLVPNVGLVRVFEPFDEPGGSFDTSYRIGDSGDLLGLYLARLEDDLLGDGVADWAITNLGEQSVTVYGGAYSEHYSIVGPCTDGASALAGADDVDGDGVGDLLLGRAGGGSTVGTACFFSGADGSWIDTLSGAVQGDRFGSAVAGLDMDGDGRSEVWVGARLDDTAAVDAGAVFVYAPFPSGPPSEVYGCGVNPAGSLVELGGLPAVGDTWTLGVLDPTGQQPPGSVAFLAVSTAPAPGFPCGVALPEFGMGAGPAPGELLVSATAPNPVLLLGPKLYTGAPASLALHVPNDPAFAGLPLFAQGVLVDFLAGFGLTEARSFSILP